MLIKHLKIKKETGKKKKETKPFLNVKKLNGKKSICPKTTCKKKVNAGFLLKGQINAVTTRPRSSVCGREESQACQT